MIDLGDNHTLEFTCWRPDRDLNPQYDGIPDVERYGATVRHGDGCLSGILFDGDVQQKLHAIYVKWAEKQGLKPRKYIAWQVECWEPLTISPSLLCLRCGDHGYIRQGKWVKA